MAITQQQLKFYKRFVPAEYDDNEVLVTPMVELVGLFFQPELYYDKIAVDNKLKEFEQALDWKEAVENFEDIAIAYPEPEKGWTVNVTSTGITYQWNGTDWVNIMENSLSPASETQDGLMSKEDYKKLKGIAPNANNYIHPATHDAGIITQTDARQFVTKAEKEKWNQLNTFPGLAGSGTANTAARSDHNHTGVYEPAFTKNTAFNKNFGVTAGTVAQGDHNHKYAGSETPGGIANGAFKLHGSVGNPVIDLNTIMDTGDDLPNLSYRQFNLSSANIFPANNNANAVLNIRTHNNDSAHKYYGHQIGFSSNGTLYHRYGAAANSGTGTTGDSWTGWNKILQANFANFTSGWVGAVESNWLQMTYKTTAVKNSSVGIQLSGDTDWGKIYLTNIDGVADDASLIIESGDNGNEPIFVQQNAAGVVKNKISLMDKSGNQIFNDVTAKSISAPNAYSTRTVIRKDMSVNDAILPGNYKIQGNGVLDLPVGVYEFGVLIVSGITTGDSMNRQLQVYYPHAQPNSLGYKNQQYSPYFRVSNNNVWGKWNQLFVVNHGDGAVIDNTLTINGVNKPNIGGSPNAILKLFNPHNNNAHMVFTPKDTEKNWSVGVGVGDSLNNHLSIYSNLAGGYIARFYENNRTFLPANNAISKVAPTISLAIGDNDTGINWVSDDQLSFMANNQEIAKYNASNFYFKKRVYFGVNDSLTINESGQIAPTTDTLRYAGIYGNYKVDKIAHVWGIGGEFKIAPDGLGLGNFYGLAYKHTTNTVGGRMAGGHQVFMTINGIPKSSMGEGGFWTVNNRGYQIEGKDNNDILTAGGSTISLDNIRKQFKPTITLTPTTWNINSFEITPMTVTWGQILDTTSEGGRTAGVNGFPTVNNANALISINTFVDANWAHQLGFSGNGRIYHRNIAAGNIQQNWKSLLFDTDTIAATTLKTARLINGTSFNGSSDITTAKWGNARRIDFGGDLRGNMTIDGSKNETINITVPKAIVSGLNGDVTRIVIGGANAGKQDKSWKKILATSSAESGNYKSIIVVGNIYLENGNYNQGQTRIIPFQVIIPTRGNNTNANVVQLILPAWFNGDFIRIVKLSGVANSYELQMRQQADWTRVSIVAELKGNNDSTVWFPDTPNAVNHQTVVADVGNNRYSNLGDNINDGVLFTSVKPGGVETHINSDAERTLRINRNGTANIPPRITMASNNVDKVQIYAAADTLVFGTPTKTIFKMFYGGNAETLGTHIANGFNKNGSNNSHVLLGGGGHKILTDFITTNLAGTRVLNITDYRGLDLKRNDENGSALRYSNSAGILGITGFMGLNQGNITVGGKTFIGKRAYCVSYGNDTAQILFALGDMDTGSSAFFNGTVYAPNFEKSSDETLKENISENIDLSKISNIKFKQFNFKDLADNRRKYGVIAQEVQKYYPELVSGDEKSKLSVDYDGLFTLKIAKLETEVSDLKDQIAKLTELVNHLINPNN